MATKEVKVYEIINNKAGSNMFIQGLSGMLGFPFTMFVDAGVFFTHYGPMLNSIRSIYGMGKADDGAMKTIISGCGKEVIADLVVDKVVGNIPLFGIPANIVCAKAMTWRLGILFGMLSSRGREITPESVEKTVILIREAFPQTNPVFFKKPSVEQVERLLSVVEGMELASYKNKLDMILDGFGCDR